MALKFNLKDLFLSVTLISIGVGMLTYLFFPTPDHVPVPLTGPKLGLWIAAGPFIGSGIFVPLKRPILGSLLGLAVQITVWLSAGVLWG